MEIKILQNNLLIALSQLVKAFVEVEIAWGVINPDMEIILEGQYPFNESFNEVVKKVAAWEDMVKVATKNQSKPATDNDSINEREIVMGLKEYGSLDDISGNNLNGKVLEIKKCPKCNNSYYMDDGDSCQACSVNFCSGCASDQGFSFSDIFGSSIYVCRDCVAEYREKGMNWLRSVLFEEFEENVFLEALIEFERKLRLAS